MPTLRLIKTKRSDRAVLRLISCISVVSIQILTVSSGLAADAPDKHDFQETARNRYFQRWAEIQKTWPRIREQEWQNLVRTAGEVKGGIQLSLRRIHFKQESATSLTLLVQIRNVSEKPVPYCEGSSLSPALWLRDRAGNPVPLTPEGLDYYKPRLPGATSCCIMELQPGSIRGMLYSPGTHFLLKAQETYTAIGVGRVDNSAYDMFTRVMDAKERLVSKPAVLKLADDSGSKLLGKNATRDEVTAQSATAENALNKEWTDLTAKAGQMRNSCVLEAMISPLACDKLVVSLSYQDLDRYFAMGTLSDGSKQCLLIPTTGNVPEDYRILLRDSRGQVTALNPSATSGSDRNEVKRKIDGTYLPFGDGIGAVVPLSAAIAKLQPGECTILVSLHSRESTGPTWVAEPIKIQVGGAATRPSKRPHRALD
jgi:hypothetical protein